MSTLADNDKMWSKLSFNLTSSNEIQIAPANFVLLVVEYIVHGITDTHVDAVAKAVIQD